MWVLVWWFCFCAHQVANECEFGFLERSEIYDYENDIPLIKGEPSWLESEAQSYYFAGQGILILTSSLVIIDFDWIPMTAIQLMYCLFQSVHIWFRFKMIFTDYVLAVVFGQPIVFTSNYLRIKSSKQQFLQSIKINCMLYE